MATPFLSEAAAFAAIRAHQVGHGRGKYFIRKRMVIDADKSAYVAWFVQCKTTNGFTYI